MIKRPHSCSSERGCSPHRLSSCNDGAYESSNRAEDGGLQPPGRYARYLLFCSFGDAFINQTPSPRRSSGIFQVRDSVRHAWRPYFTLFPPPVFELPFARRNHHHLPTHPRRTDASRRDPTNPRARRDFIESTREISADSSSSGGKFTPAMRAVDALFQLRACNLIHR